MTKTLTAVLLLAASTTYAQMPDLNGPLPAELKADSASQKTLKGKLEEALVGMNDGGDLQIGPDVVEALEAKKVVIVFARHNRAAVSAKDKDGKPVISLSDALPRYPRPIALALAREAADLMLEDMTPSSEREYMKQSIAARAWIELGGEPGKLPVVEPLTGEKQLELHESIRIWVENKGEAALEKLGQAKGTKSLLALLEGAKTDAEKKKLEADEDRFIKFMLEESYWRMSR